MNSVLIKKGMKVGVVSVVLLGVAYVVSTEYLNRPLITFVCTGNTGRSVMAAYIAEHETLGRYRINSRGVRVRAHETKPEKHAASVLKESNIDVSKHRAKQLTKQDVMRAKLILTMTKAQKDQITTNIAPGAHNVYLLSECANGVEEDIPDAYNQKIAFYRVTRDKIEGYLQKIIAHNGKCHVRSDTKDSFKVMSNTP